MVISNHSSFRVLFDKIASVSLFEKYINILELEMASPGNRHCANCIGALVPHYCACYLRPWLAPLVTFVQHGQEYRWRSSDSIGSSTDLTAWRILKLTHQWAAPDQIKLYIYDCLVTVAVRELISDFVTRTKQRDKIVRHIAGSFDSFAPHINVLTYLLTLLRCDIDLTLSSYSLIILSINMSLCIRVYTPNDENKSVNYMK